MTVQRFLSFGAALLFTCAPGYAGFINGVESFDGTVKDSATWQEYVPAGYTPVVQNNTITFPANSTMSNTGDYTSFATVVAGQAVSADVTLINPNNSGFTQSFFLLTNNSAGATASSLSDSKYIGVMIWYETGINKTQIAAFNNGTSLTYAMLPGPHYGETFKVQIDRLNANEFTYRAWDNVGTLLGTYTTDVTAQTIPNVYVAPPIPSNLHISLAGLGRFDNVAITPEPSSPMVLAMAACGAMIRRRARAALRGCSSMAER